MRLTGKGPRWTGTVRLIEKNLLDPVRARAPRCYFVASTSDPFHKEVPDEWRDRAFASIAVADRHLYILLTKHGADNGSMPRYLSDPETPRRIAAEIRRLVLHPPPGYGTPANRRIGSERADELDAGLRWPLPSLLLGVSAGVQAAIDARVPKLLASPAWRRLLSIEPLLERVTVAKYLRQAPLPWLILGGESGPGARWMDLEWLRALIAEGRQAGARVFVKQLGLKAFQSGEHDGATSFMLPRPDDGKAGDPAEWAEDLRVREWPEVAA